MPTTSTRLPRQPSPLRYRQLCRIGPPKRSLPGHSGRCGARLTPVATTTLRARNAVSSVRTPPRRAGAALRSRSMFGAPAGRSAARSASGRRSSPGSRPPDRATGTGRAARANPRSGRAELPRGVCRCSAVVVVAPDRRHPGRLLQQHERHPGPAQASGGRQPRGAGPDDDGIGGSSRSHAVPRAERSAGHAYSRPVARTGKTSRRSAAVSRVLFRRCRRWWSFLWAARCRTARATNSRLDRRGPRRRGFPAGPRDPGLGLAPGGVCRAPAVTGGAVRSYRTVSPLPDALPAPAVCFLLHCPSSHLDWPLASTLPCGARTFLDGRPRPRRDHLSGSEREASASIPRIAARTSARRSAVRRRRRRRPAAGRPSSALPSR